MQRRDKATVLEATCIGDDIDLVDLTGAILMAIDLLQAEDVGSEARGRLRERFRCRRAALKVHAVQQVERRQASGGAVAFRHALTVRLS